MQYSSVRRLTSRAYFNALSDAVRGTTRRYEGGEMNTVLDAFDADIVWIQGERTSSAAGARRTSSLTAINLLACRGHRS